MGNGQTYLIDIVTQVDYSSDNPVTRVYSRLRELARALDERLDKIDARIGALEVDPPESAPTRAELVERVRQAVKRVSPVARGDDFVELLGAIDALLAHESRQP